MTTTDELKHICDMTVELTRLRQNEVKHLCIENFAPELLGKLLRELKERRMARPQFVIGIRYGDLALCPHTRQPIVRGIGCNCPKCIVGDEALAPGCRRVSSPELLATRLDRNKQKSPTARETSYSSDDCYPPKTQ